MFEGRNLQYVIQSLSTLLSLLLFTTTIKYLIFNGFDISNDI